MTKIIINADDFGFSEAVNYGVMEAHLNGVLTSTTLMVTMPAAEHAAEMMKNLPKLGVGLHLNISLGKPLTDGKSIVDSAGRLIKPKDLEEIPYTVEDVYNEFREQYDWFIALTNQKPTHFDTHLFSSDKIEVVGEAVVQLANEESIPVRNKSTEDYKKIEFITFRKYGDEVGLDYLFKRYEDFKNYDYIEIMTHPSYLDHFILENSSYNTERLDELEILTSDKLKKLLMNEENQLVHYGEIKEEIKR